MTNASDITTYTGIPLAVLGVLPILYTAINSLVNIRKIKQSLRHNGLFEATTRSSLMSGEDRRKSSIDSLKSSEWIENKPKSVIVSDTVKPS